VSGHVITERGFRQVASQAGGVVVDRGDGWSSIEHPETKFMLQRTPLGAVAVHTDQGSWGSGENAISTLTAMWRGRL